MKTLLLPAAMMLALMQMSSIAGAMEEGEEKTCPTAGNPEVAALLKTIREKHRVPAMAGALVTSKGVAAIAAVGIRKKGKAIAVTLNDQWHLGSDTKAMTATLIAWLIEQERLRWDTTLADLFPEMSVKFHPDMRGITVLQLLSHHAGLPPNPNLAKYRGESGPQERQRIIETELAKPPQNPPGTKYQYSNLGYIIAGAMVEKLTNESWQKNMTDHVFTPLKMTHVGFGGMGTPGEIDQPWGHNAIGFPVPGNGPAVDNPPALGPAGRVHCTLQDWAKFIADQLRGARGESAILKKTSYMKLHQPAFDDKAALGWMVEERDWGEGAVLNHCGSNTMYFANAWVAPKGDLAILVCVNQGGDTAFKASDEAVGALIKYYKEKIKK